MPMQLKTEDVNGKTYALVQDGKPVYVHDDGKEVPFDAIQSVNKISALNGEAKGHREAKEAAETALKAFEGLDAEAAKKALATVKNIKDGELIAAGEADKIKSEARKAAEEQVAAIQKEMATKLQEVEQVRDKLQNDLYNEKIGGSFARSKFIQEHIIIPPDMVQARFGQNFKIEDGKIIAYTPEGNKVFSRKTPGEVAEFEEALELLVDNYPFRDHILKGKGGGSGSKPGQGGNGRADKTLTRQEFDVMDPATKALKMGEGYKVVDTAA